MLIFKNHAYFSVTSFVLNDVNIRGGKVVKPSPSQKNGSVLTDKREMSQKTIYVYFMHVKCLF